MVVKIGTPPKGFLRVKKIKQLPLNMLKGKLIKLNINFVLKVRKLGSTFLNMTKSII